MYQKILNEIGLFLIKYFNIDNCIQLKKKYIYTYIIYKGIFFYKIVRRFHLLFNK